VQRPEDARADITLIERIVARDETETGERIRS